MRLICPNCSAEYKVDASLLPPGGRHVVCSACNFTWFEAPGAPGAPGARDDDDLTLAGGPSAREEAAEAGPSGPPPAPDGPAPDISPRTVSGAALDILREEAEFEARLRARDAETHVNQEAPSAPDAAPVPTDVLPETPKTDPLPDHPSASLPASPAKPRTPAGDTTRPQARVVPVRAKPAPRKKMSRWFALPLGLLAALILVYLLAPGIIIAMPEAEGAVTAYVQAVDTLRLRLTDLPHLFGLPDV